MKKKNTIGLNGYEREEFEKSSKLDTISFIFGLILFTISVIAPVAIIIATISKALLE